MYHGVDAEVVPTSNTSQRDLECTKRRPSGKLCKKLRHMLRDSILRERGKGELARLCGAI